MMGYDDEKTIKNGKPGIYQQLIVDRNGFVKKRYTLPVVDMDGAKRMAKCLFEAYYPQDCGYGYFVGFMELVEQGDTPLKLIVHKNYKDCTSPFVDEANCKKINAEYKAAYEEYITKLAQKAR